MTTKKPTNQCDKYAISITNYVLGEKIDVPEAELAEHLKSCEKCRAEFTDWQNVYATLRTEAYHKKPEVKAKWEKFIKELVNQPASLDFSALPPPCRIGKVDETQRKALEEAKKKIFLASGKLCQFLKTNGPTPLMKLRKGTGLISDPFYETMGWLTMNEIVVPTSGKNTETIYALTNQKG